MTISGVSTSPSPGVIHTDNPVSDSGWNDDKPRSRMKRATAEAVRAYFKKNGKEKTNAEVSAFLQASEIDALTDSQINSVRNRLGKRVSKPEVAAKKTRKARASTVKLDMAHFLAVQKKVSALAEEVGGMDTLAEIATALAKN